MADDMAQQTNNDDNQAGNQQVGEQVPGEDEQQAARVRRTHVSPEVIIMLEELPLYNKLEMNKNIELANNSRKLKKANHAIDSIRYPSPGSDIASEVTIDENDLTDLLDDSIRELYKDVLGLKITKWLAEVRKTMSGESQHSLKRPIPVSDAADSSKEAREAKRRCMSGDDIMPRQDDLPTIIFFPQILYDTEILDRLPMSAFTHRGLRYIIDHAATLDTVKANPMDGMSKGLRILDIEKLSNKLGDELSLSHSEWTEAAAQMYRFQQSRDRDGPAGKFAGWFNKHFNFFDIQTDKVAMYDAWKHLELELHKEFRSERKEYDVAHYSNRYALAKSEAKTRSMRDEDRARFASLEQLVGKMFPARGGSGNGNGRFTRPGNASTSTNLPPSPFPSSSSKTSLPACCILCAKRGHTIASHADDTSIAKSTDGKPTWAKYSNRLLRGPDNKEICIRFNLKGDRAECVHSKDERAHICSFCGKGHHAFSWTCRSRPSDV